MANKSIKELPKATQIQEDDALPMQQGSVTKQVTGQTLTLWLLGMADGHGGVSDFQKLSESGLEKTYQFLMADGTKYQFTVTNGNGIADFQESVSGLVHTCKFIMDYGTAYSFTVSDGEKGDKGDNAYFHVRFASQKPTSSGSSMGTEPDAWMGVYSSHDAIAPTDPMVYTWVRILGAQGPTGAPATLVTNKTEYQVSDSGTIVPSGNWSTAIPPVTPGKYLWARTTTQFNTGAANYAYSISRFGIDGSGSVVTVNDVSPDENGNVELTAEKLQCLGLAGGTMTGPINMNGQAITGLNDPSGETEAVRLAYADKTYVAIANNVGGHNSVYRGKNLGASVTPEQWASIKAGTFDDMFIGDYWYNQGVHWRIAAFDYFAQSKAHHIVIIPDEVLTASKMFETTSGLEGGYQSSYLYNTVMPNVLDIIKEKFADDAHLLQVSTQFINAVNASGVPTGIAATSVKASIMNELQAYGTYVNAAIMDASTGAKALNAAGQFPLFAKNNRHVMTGQAYWLRDPAGTTFYCAVNKTYIGHALVTDQTLGVRPYFCIYQA